MSVSKVYGPSIRTQIQTAKDAAEAGRIYEQALRTTSASQDTRTKWYAAYQRVPGVRSVA